MKTSPLNNSESPNDIKPLALISAITALLGIPVTAMSESMTLQADSYAPKAISSDRKNGKDPILKVSKSTIGFIKFSLADSLPTGVSATDVEKATLKLYMPAIKRGGNLTVRRVLQDWGEYSVPEGALPSLELGQASSFAIKKGFCWALGVD